MKHYRTSKSGLFLREILLNLFIFIITVTVCMQLFFKAHTLSKNTVLLHQAVKACTSIAEVCQSNLEKEDMILTVFPEALVLNNTILIYFDSNFTACSEFDSTYRAILSDSEASDEINIRFLRKEGSDIVYELTISSYTPQTLQALTGGTHR